MVINGVDFDDVAKEAFEAAKNASDTSWDELSDIVENIAKGITSDVEFIVKKKAKDEFDESDAKIFMDDQKTVARMRLRSVAIITLKTAELIWNAITTVFNTAINKAIGWKVI